MGMCSRRLNKSVRSNGNIVRFDTSTNEYGVLAATGIIRTYYMPDPAVHLQPTNLDYFHGECAK
jgi:filamentous hemagglutinin